MTETGIYARITYRGLEDMKRFIDGLHSEEEINRYKVSLIQKYKIPFKRIEEADIVILDGFICKEKYNPLEGYYNEKVEKKIIIGGANPYGERKLFSTFY